jgi:hypothetical protein
MEVFRQPWLRDHIRDLGIELISYRPLCDAMHRRPPAGSMSLGDSISAFAKKANHRSGQAHLL